MEWREIKHYENLYSVSNGGYIKNKRGNCIYGWRVNGEYRKIRLYKNKKYKDFYIHRLVGKYFVPNPENKPNINHKDNDPSNNYHKNLEWVTQKENMQHASRQNRLNRNGNIVVNRKTKEEFISVKQAAESIQMKANTLVYKLSGKRVNDTDLGYKDMLIQTHQKRVKQG